MSHLQREKKFELKEQVSTNSYSVREVNGGNNKIQFSEQKNYDLHSAKIEFEKQYILQALEANDWQISKTAEMLNIDRTGLHRKINEYGIKNAKEELE